MKQVLFVISLFIAVSAKSQVYQKGDVVYKFGDVVDMSKLNQLSGFEDYEFIIRKNPEQIIFRSTKDQIRRTFNVTSKEEAKEKHTIKYNFESNEDETGFLWIDTTNEKKSNCTFKVEASQYSSFYYIIFKETVHH